MLFPTMLVGSYPQPEWLVDKERLRERNPPRIRRHDYWRVPPDALAEAQADATLIAIRDQERAGLDIVTDGEIRRESYSNHFCTALGGLDLDNPASVMTRAGTPDWMPRIVGKIGRLRPVEVEDVRLLRRSTDRPIKITLPGPFTASRQAKDEHYGDEAAVAMDYADAVNAEVRDLFAAGADIVQLDEPWLEAQPERARQYGVAAINRALAGATGRTAVHLCFGYGFLTEKFKLGKPNAYTFLAELEESAADMISVETAQCRLDPTTLAALPSKTIILGVIDLSVNSIETPETVRDRVLRAIPHVAPERIAVAPDCGMKYLPRPVAFAKLQAMVAGAKLAREAVG